MRPRESCDGYSEHEFIEVDLELGSPAHSVVGALPFSQQADRVFKSPASTLDVRRDLALKLLTRYL
jgi:hypothetical protein